MLGDVEYGALVNKARIRKIETLEDALIASRGSLVQALTVLRSRHRYYPTGYSEMAIKSAEHTLEKIKAALS